MGGGWIPRCLPEAEFGIRPNGDDKPYGLAIGSRWVEEELLDIRDEYCQLRDARRLGQNAGELLGAEDGTWELLRDDLVEPPAQGRLEYVDLDIPRLSE